MWIAIGLTILWIFILVQIIIHFRNLEITGSWEQHRCDPSVMFTASMYNTDPTRSGAAFASENFVYCTRRLATSVLATVFSPVTAALNGLLDGADKGMQSVGIVGNIAKRLFNGLQAMLDVMFSRYQNTYLELRKTLIRLMSSMSRLHAAGIASVYMGISMVQAFFSAYEFVKKVVMIILGILISLLFLLFFALLPTIPLILAVIAAVGAGGGMASEFCFTESTKIILEDGKTMPVSTINLGQKLYGGSIVTAVLELDGCGVPLWNYNGIHVSGAHIVYDETWKQVCNTSANLTNKTANKLWCLITSDRKIHVQGTKIVCFKDYEEINDAEMYLWWDKAVHSALGSKFEKMPDIKHIQNEGLHPCTYIETKNRGILPINSLSIGDTIRDANNSWTDITGIVYYEATDTTWIKHGCTIMGNEQLVFEHDKWQRAGHFNTLVNIHKPEYSVGIFTQSRTFVTADGVYLRDASEHDGSIDAIYTQKLLNSLNRGFPVP